MQVRTVREYGQDHKFITAMAKIHVWDFFAKFKSLLKIQLTFNGNVASVDHCCRLLSGVPRYQLFFYHFSGSISSTTLGPSRGECVQCLC